MAILVVDDLPGNRMLLKHVLEASGFKDIVLAESAQEALAILGVASGSEDTRHDDVDLVLMDIMVPGAEGMEVLRLIKGADQHRDTPVIIVAAAIDLDSLKNALRAGATDCISKPINKIELISRVHSALALKKEMEARKKREQDLLEITRLLKDTNQRLRHITNLDGLTGIPNRRRALEYLETEWKRGVRDQSPLSVLMIDVDSFKKYNDTYGHQAGDDCLCLVANCLERSLHRPSHLVGKYGGEEFIAVLPRTPSEEAHEIGDRMRRMLEEADVPHLASAVANHVTVSIGLSTIVPAQALNPTNLIAEADQALYKAKQSGRNRLVKWDGC